MINSPIKVELDTKQLAAFRKRVERWQGAPLRTRMQKGVLKAADYMVRPIRAGSPRRSGRLRSSVRAKPSGTMGATVGPTAPHRHLVIRGTHPHSLGTTRAGKSMYSVLPDGGVRKSASLHHPGSSGNPFVDEAAQAHSGDAFRIVSAILFGPG